MHLSIPETLELKDGRGSTYTAFVIHVNGVKHCVVRYRQLHALNEQLRRDHPQANVPSFPPKKFMPLSHTQLEERRLQLERYLQLLSQDSRVLYGTTFNGFLLGAQLETRGESLAEVTVDVFLMNDQKVAVRGVTVMQTEEVLERVCHDLEVPDELVYFFGLYLLEKREGGELAIVRRLQDFESPYIAQKSVKRKLVLRKASWDPALDEKLFYHRSTLNLVYFQTVAEVERGWVVAGPDIRKALATMQARGTKLEYMHTASKLKHYGYVHFDPCICDYPCTNTAANVVVGNRELILRIRSPTLGEKTGFFKVTKMRCWRIMTVSRRQQGFESSVVTDGAAEEAEEAGEPPSNVDLELSFEYLMHSGELQWITIVSRQAILMSLCLQSMVEELLRERNGVPIKKAGERSCSVDYAFLRRDGSVQDIPIRSRTQQMINDSSFNSQKVDPTTLSSMTGRQYSVKRLSERFAAVRFREAARAAEDVFFENEAYSGGGETAAAVAVGDDFGDGGEPQLR